MAGIFALAFAMIGPFESHHVLTVAQRLAYCAVTIGLHLIVAYAGFVATLYLTRGRTQTVVALALEVLVIAAPCTAITYTVYGVYAHLHLSPPVHDFRIIREIYSAAVPSLLGATALVYYVLRLRVVALQGAGGGASAEMRPPNATTPARLATLSTVKRPGASRCWCHVVSAPSDAPAVLCPGAEGHVATVDVVLAGQEQNDVRYLLGAAGPTEGMGGAPLGDDRIRVAGRGGRRLAHHLVSIIPGHTASTRMFSAS